MTDKLNRRDFRSLKPEERREFLKREVVGKKLYRNFEVVRRDGINADDRTVDLSFSSDMAGERYFYTEVLSHKDGAIKLDRLNSGGALLKDHDTRTQVGKVVEGTAETDGKKARATVKFSKRQIAEDEFQDVVDGIRQLVSVGYEIHKYEYDEKSETLTATLWEPLEISLVSIPFDTTVGVGRELETPAADEVEQVKARAKELGLEIVEPGATAEEPEARATENPDEVKSMPEKEENKPVVVSEVARATEIMDLAKVIDAPGESLAQEVARDAIAQGKNVAEFRQMVFDKRQSREQENKTPLKQGNVIDLTEREKKAFSITRAILADANMRDRSIGGDTNSLELEISDEIRKRIDAPGYKQRGGVLIPSTIALRGAVQAERERLQRQMMQRSGLDTQTDTAGEELVFTEPGSFIDLLRNRAMVIALGATVMPGLQGNIAFPKQIGAGTFTWVGENPGSDVAESNLTLDQVEMSPKTGQSTTSYSRQLLRQSVVNIDALVMQDMATIAALAIDRAALHGGGGSAPTGIYAQGGVNSVAMGGAISFDKIVDMETEIENDNAAIGTMAYLTTPGVRGKAKKTAELENTIALPMWRGGEMNGYRAEATNQVSKTLGAGSEHGIVFGVWSQLLVGEWGALEIITDPYALKKQGMIEVTSFLMVDIALRYAEAFVKGTGLTV